MARDVRVAILGDARDFSRAVGQVQRDTGRLGGSFNGIKKLAGGLALGVAAREVFDLGKGFVNAAIESQKVTKQTDAVIKSMGGAANVTADQVSKLSTALSLKSGIDDELIQSGSNLLLTFGKIRNEAGKGNDVFDRANAAALDMSVAMGVDMKTAALQVGKALNDPIKGMVGLNKAGVQFTDEQKKRIKWLVENNRTMDAQKIILDELGRQFGGSAEAQATATDKLKVAWGNIQEQLGAKLLPIVEKVATWLADHLPGAMARAGAAVDAMRPAFEAVVAFVRDNWPQIQQTITAVMESVRQVIQAVLSVAQTLWENFGNNILEFVRRVWPSIRQTISGALEAIRGVIQVVTSLIRGDWSGVWEGIKMIVHGAWNVIAGRVRMAIETIRAIIGIGLEIIGSIFKAAWNGIVGWFGSLPTRVGNIATAIWNALKRGLSAAISWIRGQLDRLMGPLDEIAGKVGQVTGLAGKVGGLIGKIPGFDAGGVVPGPRGAPRLVLAHGGETIFPTHKADFHAGRPTGSGGGGDTIIIQVGDREIARLYADGKVRADRRGYAA